MHTTLFKGIDHIAFTKELKEKGVAFGLKLPKQVVDEITAFALSNPCYADRNPAKGFMLSQRDDAQKALSKQILVAQYFNVIASCPSVKLLLDDPLLCWVAASYIESIPTFVGANLWWTFPVKASEADRNLHAHLFHRDLDDFRFFKFFFYLTDVNSGEGAHVCVAASHLDPPQIKMGDRWNIRRYSDDEINGYYNKEQILEITGESGIGFAEDTLCVHKGRTPSTNPRLLLQLQYALFNYGVMHDERPSTSLQKVV
jgi:hypothetical protein